MILSVGLLALATILVVVGTVCWAFLREGHPVLLSQLEAGGYDRAEALVIFAGVAVVGLFLAICAFYIWSHP